METVADSPSSLRDGETADAVAPAPSDDTLRSQSLTLLGVAWSGPKRVQFALLVGGIIAVICITVAGQLRLNAWYKDFYNAIEGRNVSAFGLQLAVFGIIVAGLLTLNVAQTWLNQMIKLRTRERLTRDLVGQWLMPKRDFLLAGAGPISRNPDQRIHEDAHHLSELTADLTIGLTQSFLLLVSFIGVLWVVSSGVLFTFGGQTFAIPGYMVWCALAYATLGSLLSWAVGRPLVALNVERYQRESNLRFELVRANENIDGISLYRGEAAEEGRLNGEIDRLLAVIRSIVGAVTRLTWVTAGYGWLAIVIPILAAAPGYFEGRLSFGDLMMVAGAFNQVQGSLRWFVDNFGNLADWRATLRRVIGFRQVLLRLGQSGAGGSHIAMEETDRVELVLDKVMVTMPGGGARLDPDEVVIAPGDHVQILGAAAVGKSCLFRAMSGLWPWGGGVIHVPHGARLAFIPQRPYIAPGTLRSVLAYPHEALPGGDAALAAALRRVGLEYLQASLDKNARWDKDLTLEVQQRLSFARLLLTKPDFIFLDEAFDILEEEHREMIASIFDRELASAAVINFTRHKALNGSFKRSVHLVATEPGHKATRSDASNGPLAPERRDGLGSAF